LFVNESNSSQFENLVVKIAKEFQNNSMARIFGIFLLFFCTCFCLTPPRKYLGVDDTHLDSKIAKLLQAGNAIILLVLAPKELSVTSCNLSDGIFDTILKQSSAQLESQFLSLHGSHPNFKLVDRSNLSDVMEEVKIQAQGLTSNQTVKIGKVTGANYLVISSATLSCSDDGRELVHNGNSKLIRIESSTTEAIDVTKLVLSYNEDQKNFKFKKGFVNGKLVDYDPDRDVYSWGE
jgi:hypothetical protein